MRRRPPHCLGVRKGPADRQGPSLTALGFSETIRRLMGETPGEETIGERIRRLRLAQGLSQRELSGPGISYAYVSRIEANQRTPSLQVIRLLARRLDVDPGYIETGDPVSEAAKRELRLADAELELRLGQDEARAEAELDALMREKANDITGVRARAALGLLASRRADHLRTIRLLKGATASSYITPEARGDVYEALAAAYAANGRPIERSACRGSASRPSPTRRRPSASWSGTSRCWPST